jgi:hypothetical protein
MSTKDGKVTMSKRLVFLTALLLGLTLGVLEVLLNKSEKTDLTQSSESCLNLQVFLKALQHLTTGLT